MLHGGGTRVLDDALSRDGHRLVVRSDDGSVTFFDARTLREAGRFDDLLAAHALAWAHLWEECNFEIEETQPAETALKLRVYIFHLLQTLQ